MPNPFGPIIIVCTALGIILGFTKPNALLRRLAMMLFMPLFISITLSLLRNIAVGMNIFEQMLLWSIVLIVGLVVILRFILGHELFQHVLGGFVYDVLRWFVMLPFRVLRAVFRR